MVPPNSHKVSRVSWYFGFRSLSSDFMYGAFTLSGGTSQTLPLSYESLITVHNPRTHALWFRLLPFRSPLLWKSSFLSFPRPVQAVPDVTLWIHVTTTEVCSARFPHSDISGSLDMCSSPKLFAAYHVFHRLLVPRHPPCALTTLTVAGTIESLDSLFPH